jgi:hypothetical protein
MVSIERCAGCPVAEVEDKRVRTRAGKLLERVLEHEFDCKHYKVEMGEVEVGVREGLKVLEQERGKWEEERAKEREEENEEKRRVVAMQRKQMGGR